MAKQANMVKVPNVRIAKGESVAVKFKRMANGLVRATARGHAPIFVKPTDKGFEAKVRGDEAVTAKTPAQAFARAVHANWSAA